ncbi:MAG TPA: phage portal protein [Micromonosporaceae bacterium]|nr:phage portal protein [Micromonosporaceae bacterium]
MTWWARALSWLAVPHHAVSPPQRVTFDAPPRPIDQVILEMSGQGSAPRVGRVEALSVPAVQRGRNLICSIATLPLVQRDKNRAVVINPLFEQLDPDVPNVVTLAQTLEDLFFEGIGWWRITGQDFAGYPIAVRRLDPSSVSLTPPGNAGSPAPLPAGHDPRGAAVWIDGVRTPASVVIRFDSPNPAVLKVGGRAIRRAILLDQTARMYADDPRPLDYFTPGEGADPIDDDDVAVELAKWKAARRKRSTAWIPLSMKYNTVDAPSPADLQLVQLQQQVSLDLANALGVDPEELGISTTSRTYFNAIDRRQSRINDVLLPYMRAVTDRLSMGDVTRRGHKVVFDLDDYLRADPTTRWNVYKTALDMGAITVEEIREEEGWTPLPPGGQPQPAPPPPPAAPPTNGAAAARTLTSAPVAALVGSSVYPVEHITDGGPPSLAAHLPGKHDQSSHGRRKNKIPPGDAATPPAAKKATPPKEPPPPPPPSASSSAADVAAGDFSGLKRVGKQSGANPGGVFEAADGSRWYIKVEKSEEHAQNSRLAAALYGATDVAVPELFVGSGAPGLPAGPQTATRFLDDAETDLRARVTDGDATYLARIREGFAVDALLANWDVAGENPGGGWDNIVSVGGTPWRVDVGGALAFRGLGAPKGDAFGPSVTEWDKFRDPVSPRASAAVFSGMTPAQLDASVERVKKLTPAKIRSVVKANGGDPALAELLIARRKDLLSRHKAETKKKLAQPASPPKKGTAALVSVPLDNKSSTFVPELAERAGLTTVEAAEIAGSVGSYQNGQYGPINRSLLRAKGGKLHPEIIDAEGEVGGDVPRHVANIDTVMEHSRLTADIILYRGERNPSRNFPPGVWSDVGGMEGAEWTFHGYASTSTRQTVARNFATSHVSPGGQPTVITITARKGTPALAMSGIHEDEILLDRGLGYRVVADHGVIKGVRMLDVEVIA